MSLALPLLCTNLPVLPASNTVLSLYHQYRVHYSPEHSCLWTCSLCPAVFSSSSGSVTPVHNTPSPDWGGQERLAGHSWGCCPSAHWQREGSGDNMADTIQHLFVSTWLLPSQLRMTGLLRSKQLVTFLIGNRSDSGHVLMAIVGVERVRWGTQMWPCLELVPSAALEPVRSQHCDVFAVLRDLVMSCCSTWSPLPNDFAG